MTYGQIFQRVGRGVILIISYQFQMVTQPHFRCVEKSEIWLDQSGSGKNVIWDNTYVWGALGQVISEEIKLPPRHCADMVTCSTSRIRTAAAMSSHSAQLLHCTGQHCTALHCTGKIKLRWLTWMITATARPTPSLSPARTLQYNFWCNIMQYIVKMHYIAD